MLLDRAEAKRKRQIELAEEDDEITRITDELSKDEITAYITVARQRLLAPLTRIRQKLQRESSPDLFKIFKKTDEYYAIINAKIYAYFKSTDEAFAYLWDIWKESGMDIPFDRWLRIYRFRLIKGLQHQFDYYTEIDATIKYEQIKEAIYQINTRQLF